MSWNPKQYAKFSDHRLRPALDLLARIAVEAPATVVDLGCGIGNVTACIAARWPGAAILGVDSSPEMLEEARTRGLGEGKGGKLSWLEADLNAWRAESAVDVIYSNAALHWVAHHEVLFPRLFAQLGRGGVLAVQMPRNFGAPSHRISYQLAGSRRWRDKLGDFVRPAPVHEPSFYYDVMSRAGALTDIWETEYLQPLSGERPVLEWIKGTWLKPMLDRLTAEERIEFEDEYAGLAASAYPPSAQGITLFPFRRLFVVAQRA